MNSLLARLLLVVAIALVPVLTFLAYTESQMRHVRQQLAEDEALRLLRLVSAEQQRIAEGAEQALNTLSGAPAVQDNLPDECPRLLANLLAQAPRYTFVGVVGLDGHIICGSGEFDRNVGLSDRAYFRDALQAGGFVIGEYTVGRISGRKSLHMARPFTTREGNVAGIVAVALDLDWLRQQLEHLGLPEDIAVSVRDHNGTMLARFPDGARYAGQTMPEATRFSLAGDAIRVGPMEGADGRVRIVAYAPVGTALQGVRISVGLDRDVSFAVVGQANRTGLLLIAAGAGLALVLTVVLGRHLIRRPLDRLIAVADRWRTGDLAARTNLPADSSEFGRLAAAFDRMAAALEAREIALCTALESTTNSVAVLDRSWRYTYLNARAKAKVAQGRDLLGQVIWDAFPEVAGTVFADAYRTAMESGVPTQAEDDYGPLNARFEVHAFPSKDGLTVFFRDVTEESRVKLRFRAIFEQAVVGMMLASLDCVPLRINDKLCEITGYTREKLLAGLFLDITHPDDLTLGSAEKAALLAGEIATFTIEKRYVRRDGGLVWVKLTDSLLRAPDGRAECFLVVVEDITARKQTEEDLRQTAALLRAIGNCSPDPIFAKDTESRFLFANPATLAVVGRTASEIMGRTNLEWHTNARQAAAVMANDRRVITAGRAEILEEAFDAASQGRRLFRAAKAPLRMEDGSIRGVVCVSSDITQLKETEIRLRQLTEDLQQRVNDEVAARQRQDLLMAELDHRVKDMLATIQALVRQSGTRADTLEGFLTTFEGRLRAMSFAHDMLATSRWEGASLRTLFAEALAPHMDEAVSAAAIETGTSVLLRPKAALALSLAVHELARNAAAHGALSVPGGRVCVDWQAEQGDDPALVVHWRETGGPVITPPAPRGFGLALIENSLAYELGGTVQVDFPPEGLSCTMVVPWDQIAAFTEPAPALPPSTVTGTAASLQGEQIDEAGIRAQSLRGQRILVVEDNALLAANIASNLATLGASVVGPVARLEPAVELAETAEINIALLDVDLDGTLVWPAADQLARRGIPFVFATGFRASLVMPPRFKDSPLLKKPFTVRELRAVLSRYLEVVQTD